MNTDVEKAVESLDQSLEGLHPAETHWATIKQALRDQEAEIARLRDRLREEEGNSTVLATRLFRHRERTDTLLRECRRFVAWSSERLPEAMPTYEKLDAHLGSTHE